MLRFNKTEVKHLYRIFKTECPTGILTEERFHTIFSSFFPWGDEPYQSKTPNIKTINAVTTPVVSSLAFYLEMFFSVSFKMSLMK